MHRTESSPSIRESTVSLHLALILTCRLGQWVRGHSLFAQLEIYGFVGMMRDAQMPDSKLFVACKLRTEILTREQLYDPEMIIGL